MELENVEVSGEIESEYMLNYERGVFREDYVMILSIIILIASSFIAMGFSSNSSITQIQTADRLTKMGKVEFGFEFSNLQSGNRFIQLSGRIPETVTSDVIVLLTFIKSGKTVHEKGVHLDGVSFIPSEYQFFTKIDKVDFDTVRVVISMSERVAQLEVMLAYGRIRVFGYTGALSAFISVLFTGIFLWLWRDVKALGIKNWPSALNISCGLFLCCIVYSILSSVSSSSRVLSFVKYIPLVMFFAFVSIMGFDPGVYGTDMKPFILCFIVASVILAVAGLHCFYHLDPNALHVVEILACLCTVMMCITKHNATDTAKHRAWMVSFLTEGLLFGVAVSSPRCIERINVIDPVASISLMVSVMTGYSIGILFLHWPCSGKAKEYLEVQDDDE